MRSPSLLDARAYVRADVGATVPSLGSLAAGLLAAGVVLLAGAAGLLWFGLRRTGSLATP